MTIKFYSAFIENANRGFSVFFPDLPGCTSAGRTVDEAALNAREALALHVEGMIEDGEAIPEPTPMDQIPTPEHLRVSDEPVRIYMVPVELPGKSVRVNITLDEGLIASIDRVASNRSKFLADAAQSALRSLRAA